MNNNQDVKTLANGTYIEGYSECPTRTVKVDISSAYHYCDKKVHRMIVASSVGRGYLCVHKNMLTRICTTGYHLMHANYMLLLYAGNKCFILVSFSGACTLPGSLVFYPTHQGWMQQPSFHCKQN